MRVVPDIVASKIEQLMQWGSQNVAVADPSMFQSTDDD